MTVTVKVRPTPDLLFRAVAQRFAKELTAWYGAPVETLSNAQIAAWVAIAPSGPDVLAKIASV